MTDFHSTVRTYRFGPFIVDPSKRTLTRESEPVPIAGKAFDVLLALLERRGQVVDKRDLLRLVWPDVVVEEANLSQQIFTLRKLLGEAADRRSYIATAPKRGYGFLADVIVDVREQEEAAARVPAPLPAPAVVRLTLTLPANAPLALLPTSAIAISPDGSRVVVAAASAGATQLFVRDLDSFDARPIAGSEGGVNPFFSPDGMWLGFAAGRRLMRVHTAGGTPHAICQLDGDIRGASWGPDDVIVFAPGPASGLWRVPAVGGTPRALTIVRFEDGERTHRWPHVLPDGSGVIFTIGNEGASSFDEGSLAITEPNGGHRVVLYHGSDGRYVSTGHLVYARRGALMTTRLDLVTGFARGSGRPVLSGVATAATGAAHFAVSSSGVLAYAAGETQTVRRSLVSLESDGTKAGTILTAEGVEEPRLSPDRRRVVVSLRGRHTNLWLYDFAQAPLMRLTFEGDNFAAIWGPDDHTLTFSSNRGGVCDVFCLRPDGGASAELLVASEFDKVPGSWSRDGSLLAYTEYHPETGADIWLFDRKTGASRPFLRSRFNEYSPSLSPNGRHLAFTSDATGQPEVYVVDLTHPDVPFRISTDGGAEPIWIADGEGVIYRNGDRLMTVDLRLGPSQASVPRTLFEGRYVPGTLTGLANYDHGPDPATFLMLIEEEPRRPQQLSVVLNWFEELRGK